MNIQEQVLEGLKKVVNGKEVTLESNLKELGLDNLERKDLKSNYSYLNWIEIMDKKEEK